MKDWVDGGETPCIALGEASMRRVALPPPPSLINNEGHTPPPPSCTFINFMSEREARRRREGLF